MARWKTSDTEDLYGIPAWGLGYFRVNDAGNLGMRAPDSGLEIDLKVLIDDLVARGIRLPILLRFPDLVRARITALVDAFAKAADEYGYQGSYRGVYPVKVNQERHLVEDLVRFSAPHHLGLEAGSKPELMLAMAMLEDRQALIICNGYKDKEFMEMALMGRKMGLNVVIVVEKIDEVAKILAEGKRLGVTPAIGVRAKLAGSGSGHWSGSAGDQAKFGLSVSEILGVVRQLEKDSSLGSLKLLHFHIGSQVSHIRAFKYALREATRIYTELVRLGAPMGTIDVGGGLGVDYDGSRTNFSSSMNYDVQEYAHHVIAAITEACDGAEIPHPDVVTEAGRSMVAYSSVLVSNVLGVTRNGGSRPGTRPSEDDDEALTELWTIFESVGSKNLQEPLHDAQQLREETLTRFNLGLVRLETRARVEELFWAVCDKVHRLAREADYVPEEVQGLDKLLADTYYCNFSLFQSAPDSWAIKQLFPMVPIHRLNEEPKRRGTIADVTCDSDGKIDRFIDLRDVKDSLALHDPDGDNYYLALFLVGAYQEILGDLHNLFGDTHAVHVEARADGRGYRILDVIEGDTVEEVMSYVAYDRKRLVKKLRHNIETATESGGMSFEEGAALLDLYMRRLDGYTYLVP